MLRHVIDWFMEVVGLWITIGIISLIVLVFVAARRLGFTAEMQINKTNQSLYELPYEKYDGTKVSGSEVINAVRRYQKELPITVNTGESVDVYKGEFKTAGNDSASEKYIKPSGKYIGSVLRDSEDTIIGLAFTKEGIAVKDQSYKELLAAIAGMNASKESMDDIINGIINKDKQNNDEILRLNNEVNSMKNTILTLGQTNQQLNVLNQSLTSQNKTLNTTITNGKKVISEAINEKGVLTKATDSFETLAAGIKKIETNAEMKKEEYMLDATTAKGDGDCSLEFTITAKEITPVIVVIDSYMYLSTSYGEANIGNVRVVSTSFSNGYFTCDGNYNTDSSANNYVKISGKTISVHASFSIIYTGKYYPKSGGTTKVTIYGY